MNVAGLHPEHYREQWAHFLELCRILKLSPRDRSLMWAELTGDENLVEWPVPVDYFVTDPYYVGAGINVRPRIKDILDEFWAIDSQYQVLNYVGGIGSGKSFLASLSLAYGIYLVSIMRSPMKWMSRFPGVSLSADSEIVFMTASAAGADQSSKIVYREAFTRITESPYFLERFKFYDRKHSELLFPNRIRLSPGSSSWRSALGWNVFMFVVDEAALGQVTERADYVAEMFNALNQRRRSRFGSLGAGMILTSPGTDTAYVEALARQGESWDHTMLVRRTTTWNAKGELKPGAQVFLLDRDPDRMRVLTSEPLVYISPGYLEDPHTGESITYTPAEDEGV